MPLYCGHKDRSQKRFNAKSAMSRLDRKAWSLEKPLWHSEVSGTGQQKPTINHATLLRSRDITALLLLGGLFAMTHSKLQSRPNTVATLPVQQQHLRMMNDYHCPDFQSLADQPELHVSWPLPLLPVHC